MRIKWYAHACLRIEGGGVSIITDPYTPFKSGFAPVDETADIVVRSSDDDSAHANAAMIPGDPEVVTATHILSSGGDYGTGERESTGQGGDASYVTRAGIGFTAIPALESMRVKLQPRDNAMYCFVVDGLRLVHFGDVGNRLERWQLEQMGGVDIAIVPTGGPPTIELDDLQDALNFLRPAVTIPMHHDLPGCRFPRMADVREFTRRYPSSRVVWANKPEVELSREVLPREPEVWVLQATSAGRL
ncbi:MAG: MBL fold metallo-hydrolase [Caldilineaceae bacterium]|nr:MBL fold metallo-hydrolase [Caldilineaceae bacterium]